VAHEFKVRETLGTIEEDVEEIYDRLASIEQAIEELGESGRSIKERAESYWMAHIDGALLNRGGWLGGSFVSLNDTVQEIEELLEGGEEE